jgi:hypothetical protein
MQIIIKIIIKTLFQPPFNQRDINSTLRQNQNSIPATIGIQRDINSTLRPQKSTLFQPPVDSTLQLNVTSRPGTLRPDKLGSNLTAVSIRTFFVWRTLGLYAFAPENVMASSTRNCGFGKIHQFRA